MSAQSSFLQICQNVKQLFFAFKSEVYFEALWKCKVLGVLSTPYRLSKSGIWKAKDVSVSGCWLLLIIFPELPPSPLPPSHGWRGGRSGRAKERRAPSGRRGDLQSPLLASGCRSPSSFPTSFVWGKGKMKLSFNLSDPSLELWSLLLALETSF